MVLHNMEGLSIIHLDNNFEIMTESAKNNTVIDELDAKNEHYQL